MKVRVFIFACFKNAIDWKMMDNPLNDKIPVTKTILKLLEKTDSVFAPLVTSKIP